MYKTNDSALSSQIAVVNPCGEAERLLATVKKKAEKTKLHQEIQAQ